MLFSEHPKIRVPDAGELTDGQKPVNTDADAAQERLDEIIGGGGVYRRLLEAAELASALNGVYLKVDWNKDKADHPILSVVRGDNAIPEFWYGVLTAVTFWRDLDPEVIVDMADKKRGGGEVFRLVERHEKGVIYTGLYRGNVNQLGYQIDLSARPETADIPPVVMTGLDGLACRYVPNMLPNRAYDPMYDPPEAIYLGSSDYSGAETMMESLDEVFSSLMRDIQIGQGRIIVPDSFLEPVTVDGKLNMRFDMDRKAYSPLSSPGSAGAGLKDQLTVSQFAIRTEEHIRAATALVHQIVTNAGYSPQTFGLQVEGRAESGTALNVRERKSFLTTAKKAEYWKPVIEDICEIMLIIDREHLNGTVTPMRPVCEMQDSVRSDLSQVAPSVQALAMAEAASTETLVRMVHPDWENLQVAAEVQRIHDERGSMVAPPGEGPFGQP
jgi:A118 family predicted phage portal protein